VENGNVTKIMKEGTPGGQATRGEKTKNRGDTVLCREEGCEYGERKFVSWGAPQHKNNIGKKMKKDESCVSVLGKFRGRRDGGKYGSQKKKKGRWGDKAPAQQKRRSPSANPFE